MHQDAGMWYLYHTPTIDTHSHSSEENLIQTMLSSNCTMQQTSLCPPPHVYNPSALKDHGGTDDKTFSPWVYVCHFRECFIHNMFTDEIKKLRLVVINTDEILQRYLILYSFLQRAFEVPFPYSAIINISNQEDLKAQPESWHTTELLG